MYIHFLPLLFFSLQMLSSWPHWQHNSSLPYHPEPPHLQPSLLQAKWHQGPLAFAPRSHFTIFWSILWFSSDPPQRPSRTIAASCKKCTEASQMGGHKPGALNPTPGISIFPTLCAAASALSWREHLSPFRQPAGSQGQPGKVSQRLATCCEVFGNVAGSPCEREVHALRERQWGLMGNCHLGSSQIMRCWESWLFWIRWGSLSKVPTVGNQ